MRIPGLPEGIELLALKERSEPGDFVFLGLRSKDTKPRIMRAEDTGFLAALVVGPSPDYEFVCDPVTNGYLPQRRHTVPKKVLIRCAVNSDSEERQLLDAAAHLPGICEITREEQRSPGIPMGRVGKNCERSIDMLKGRL